MFSCLRGASEDLQHAIADGVSEPVIDRFEVIEVDEHRMAAETRRRDAWPQLGAVLQEGPAVGDPGERIPPSPRCAGGIRSVPWPSPAG